MYYVYAYLRQSDSVTGRAGTPYYIGKGTRRRAFEFHNHIPVPTNKSRIVFLETNLTNVGALALERRMIEWYGRRDKGTGILHNRTDGGEGSSGRKQSVEERQRRSEIMMGKNKGKPGHMLGKDGYWLGKESPQKGKPSANKGRPGRKWTEEQKAAKSAARKGIAWTNARRVAQIDKE